MKRPGDEQAAAEDEEHWAKDDDERLPGGGVVDVGGGRGGGVGGDAGEADDVAPGRAEAAGAAEEDYGRRGAVRRGHGRHAGGVVVDGCARDARWSCGDDGRGRRDAAGRRRRGVDGAADGEEAQARGSAQLEQEAAAEAGGHGAPGPGRIGACRRRRIACVLVACREKTACRAG